MMISKLQKLYDELEVQMYINSCCAYNKETLEIIDVRIIKQKENGDIISVDGLELKDVVFIKC